MYLLRSLKQILTGVSGNTMPLLIKASQGENMTQPLVGKQILIVEDEPVFRSLLDSWFSSLGATTALAGDGVDALELMGRLP